MAQRAETWPDLSDFPTTWHAPGDAVATLDALIAAPWPPAVLDSLRAFRAVLAEAAERGTRFHLTVT